MGEAAPKPAGFTRLRRHLCLNPLHRAGAHAEVGGDLVHTLVALRQSCPDIPLDPGGGLAPRGS
jgi:hypothetical protein